MKRQYVRCYDYCKIALEVNEGNLSSLHNLVLFSKIKRVKWSWIIISLITVLIREQIPMECLKPKTRLSNLHSKSETQRPEANNENVCKKKWIKLPQAWKQLSRNRVFFFHLSFQFGSPKKRREFLFSPIARRSYKKPRWEVLKLNHFQLGRLISVPRYAL